MYEFFGNRNLLLQENGSRMVKKLRFLIESRCAISAASEKSSSTTLLSKTRASTNTGSKVKHQSSSQLVLPVSRLSSKNQRFHQRFSLSNLSKRKWSAKLAEKFRWILPSKGIQHQRLGLYYIISSKSNINYIIIYIRLRNNFCNFDFFFRKIFN